LPKRMNVLQNKLLKNKLNLEIYSIWRISTARVLWFRIRCYIGFKSGTWGFGFWYGPKLDLKIIKNYF
jgi:hypothetical protein